MTTDDIKLQTRRISIFNLKVWKSIKWILSMLWPDKTASSRLIFSMGFFCTFIFLLNMLFTVGYSYYLLTSGIQSTIESINQAESKIFRSSQICLVLLVICYLIMFFVIRRTSTRNKLIEGELGVAANIQKQMVPTDFSVFPEKHGYDLNGILNPAKEIGGDLLDYVMRDNKLFFCIGDVSGKGMPAALFMSQVHVLLHHVLDFTQEPSDICHAMNHSLADGNDTNMFCTFFLGVINFETNVLSYCNAGHNQPVIIDDSGKAEFVKTIPNIALGLIDDFPFQTQQMDFVPGTTLITYTDGVTEAESLNKQVLGDEALVNALMGKQQLKPSQIISHIKDKIDEHTVFAEQSDDITVLVLRRA